MKIKKAVTVGAKHARRLVGNNPARIKKMKCEANRSLRRALKAATEEHFPKHDRMTSRDVA